MPQREQRLLATTCQVVAALGFLLLPLTCEGAHAQPRGELESAPDLLSLLYLVVVEPLLPLLAGRPVPADALPPHCGRSFRSRLWRVGRLVLLSPVARRPLVGRALRTGNGRRRKRARGVGRHGYAALIGAETRRLGAERTAIAHGVGVAFAAMAFVLLLVTQGSDTVGIGLYLVLLALSLGLSAATGSFGGVVATMALALIAMVHGVWGAALASGVPDAGQAYIAIFYVPPLLAPVLAIAAFGSWLGRSLRARRSDDRPA